MYSPLPHIILIGLWPHAERIYFNFFKKYNIFPLVVIDLESQKQKIESKLTKWKLSSQIIRIYLPDEEKNLESLSEKTRKTLQKVLVTKNITHAIIATEPKAHFAYSKFLIECGIHILCDKPITSPSHVINTPEAALKISSEYNELEKLLRRKNNLKFIIQCQRRFHLWYKYIKEVCRNIIQKYNIPITYIDIFHNDGMWNMPNEFLERENHPYKYWYWKLFHSWYHFVDLLTFFLEENKLCSEEKQINNCEMMCQVRCPKDFISNINLRDYLHLTGKEYNEKLFNIETYKWFWELDFFSMMNLNNKRWLITHASINLLQSGFSRRARTYLPENTYKGNGRVRHERINIHIWPLCNIQVHSYQAFEVKDRALMGQYKPWWLEHFDIYIFKNVDIIGWKVVEHLTHKNIFGEWKKINHLWYNEDAREQCFLSFLYEDNTPSTLSEHRWTIKLLTEMYYSIASNKKINNFEFYL